MENKHFSHIHSLVQYQLPQGTEICCSGCKLQASGLVYVCWECRFFLHDQCFTASRSMIHPSHPSHPLTLAAYPTYPSATFFCNSCSLIGTGFSYSCPFCEFDIHVHCAYMSRTTSHESHTHYNYYQNQFTPNYVPEVSGSIPAYPPQNNNHQQYPYMNQTSTPHGNEFIHKHDGTETHSSSHNHEKMPYFSPQPGGLGGIKHFTHGHHLHLSEVREKEMKFCSGCNKNITGLVYSCKENQCDFNLHKSCFELPSEIRHNSHPKHPLTLVISFDQTTGFTCNACLKSGFAFTYNCSMCTFDLHIDCASLPKSVKRKDHEHPLALFYDMHGEFKCDVCQEIANESCWRYRCRKCDYDTHSYCVTSDVKPVLANPELDYYKESEKVMAALAEAKIRHDSSAFILHHLI